MRWCEPRWAVVLILAAVLQFGGPLNVRAEPGIVGGLRVVAVASTRGTGGDLPLRYATEDARRFVETLTQVPPRPLKEAEVINSPDRSTLLKRLEELAQGDAVDMLTFYYSGHADERGLRLGETHLPYAELRGKLRAIPARVLVLVLDACRSGAALRAKGVLPDAALSLAAPDLNVSGEVVLASSAASEDSRESEELRSSVFTHHLLVGLRGAADRDGDDRVTVQEAFMYASRGTKATSFTAKTVQSPAYDVELYGEEALALSNLALRRGMFRLKVDVPGTVRLLWVRTGHVAEFDGGQIVLPAGPYVVSQHRSGWGPARSVDGKAGELLVLSDVPAESVWVYGTGRIKGSHYGPRIAISSGVRGGTVTGFEVGPVVRLDLRFPARGFAFGPHLRWFRSRANQASFTGTDDSWALGLSTEYLIHGPTFTWFIGLDLQGVLHTQRTTEGPTESLSQETGLYVGCDIQWWEHWSVRLHAGPRLELLNEEPLGFQPRFTGLAMLGIQRAL